MNEAKHPKYYKAEFKCSTCGTEYSIGSTKENVKIDTCSNCHPFYTGQGINISKAGRVERFNQRFSKSQNSSNQDNK